MRLSKTIAMTTGVLLLLGLAGCSAANSGQSATDSATSSKVSKISYDGPESKVPSSISKPTDSSKKLRIGFLQIYTGVSTLVDTQNAVQKTVDQLGGTLIMKDADLNPQNQVSQFNQLLSQQVDAIIVFPVDPASLGPSLQQAAAAHIPVIAQNATVAADTPLPDGYVTTINEALDSAAYAIAQHAAEQKPGGSFVVMGTSIPIPTVQYQTERLVYWGKRFGLHLLGQIDNSQDNPSGYSAAATTLAARYPDANFVFAYNDPYALAVSQVLRASGLTEPKVSMPIGGAPEGFAAVKSGKLDASYNIPWAKIGTMSVYAAYDAVAGSKLPKVVVPQGFLVTSANVGTVLTK